MTSQRNTYFLLDFPFTLHDGDEILGRFCSSPILPHFDFVPTNSNSLRMILAQMPNAPLEESDRDFLRGLTGVQSSQIQAQLAGIFGLERAIGTDASTTIQSPRPVNRVVQQVPLYFDRLLGDQSILDELHELLDRHNNLVYMAIGSLTLSDAELSIQGDTVNSIRTNSGDGLAIPPQSPADTQMLRRSESGFTQKSVIQGTRIIGISYMQVKRSYFTKNVKLKPGVFSAGKDAVYGGKESGRHSRRSKKLTAAGIELYPMSYEENGIPLFPGSTTIDL